MPGPMRDVVVLLPGILGSVLQKDGKDVWAFSGGAALRALLTLGGSVQGLELQGDDPDADELGDGITASRLMPDLHLIPGLWKIDGYGRISDTIREHLNVLPGANYFEFPYDWRRDNRAAARWLARQSHDWLRSWRERSGNDDAKLVLIGHSMGGLVARHFLEVLDGWRDTRALVTFGTPYRGSLNALDFLVHGMKKSFGPLTLFDLSTLVRSFTSVYQLLPIYPCVDPGDGALVRIAETSWIPNVDRDRAADALRFHRDIESAVTAHRSEPAYVESRYEVQAVVGLFQPTRQSARRVGDEVELLSEYEGEDQDGDGTVPRVSATPIEMSGDPREMYASERHSTLQNRDQVLVHLLGVLSRGELDLGRYRDLLQPRVGLDIADLYASDEPVTLSVRCEDPAAPLEAVVTDAEGSVVRRGPPMSAGEWTELELAPLDPGDYRVTVGAGRAVEPVSDAFAVLEATMP